MVSETLSEAAADQTIRVVEWAVVRSEAARHETHCAPDDPHGAEPLRGVVVSRAVWWRERRLRVGDAVVLRHDREVVLDHRLDRAADRPNHDGQIDRRHVQTADHCETGGLA